MTVKRDILGNEDGSIIIMALVMLVLLTLIGTSATNTSTLEIQIAGNERNYKQVFYLAEAAAMEALQTIDDEVNDNQLLPASTTWNWLVDDAAVDLANRTTMENNDTTSTLDAGTSYAVASKGIASGSSLDMSSPTQLYEYEVYGLSTSSTGSYAHIVLGYRRRF